MVCPLVLAPFLDPLLFTLSLSLDAALVSAGVFFAGFAAAVLVPCVLVAATPALVVVDLGSAVGVIFFSALLLGVVDWESAAAAEAAFFSTL